MAFGKSFSSPRTPSSGTGKGSYRPPAKGRSTSGYTSPTSGYRPKVVQRPMAKPKVIQAPMRPQGPFGAKNVQAPMVHRTPSWTPVKNLQAPMTPTAPTGNRLPPGLIQAAMAARAAGGPGKGPGIPGRGGASGGYGNSGGGYSGGGATPPGTTPPVTTPPTTTPPVVQKPPVTSTPVPTDPTGSWTSMGQGGTYGQFMRQRLNRGPRSGLSLTPEMIRRMAMMRLG